MLLLQSKLPSCISSAVSTFCPPVCLSPLPVYCLSTFCLPVCLSPQGLTVYRHVKLLHATSQCSVSGGSCRAWNSTTLPVHATTATCHLMCRPATACNSHHCIPCSQCCTSCTLCNGVGKKHSCTVICAYTDIYMTVTVLIWKSGCCSATRGEGRRTGARPYRSRPYSATRPTLCMTPPRP